MRYCVITFVFLVFFGAIASSASSDEIYKSVGDFLNESFAETGQPPPRQLWMNKELQKSATSILGHKFSRARIRYWQREQRSAWVIDEIGKEMPITVGIVVQGDHIVKVEILAFRESRGGEVRYPFFTKQFDEVGLKGGLLLDKNIDGVSGATLSVRAVKNVSRLALLFHSETQARIETAGMK